MEKMKESYLGIQVLVCNNGGFEEKLREKRREVRSRAEKWRGLLYTAVERNKNDVFGTPFIDNYKLVPKRKESA